MANKTNTEWLHEINDIVVRLSMQMEKLKEKESEDVAALREDMRRISDQLQSLLQRMSAVEVRTTHAEKAADRQWQVWLAFLAGFVALIVSVFRK